MLRWSRDILVAAMLLGGAGAALSDATEPTEDIAGAKDTELVKRYEGSFVVSYERSSYTDFVAPLGPLKLDESGKRDSSNNRFYAPETSVELEGALTRLAYVMPPDRSPLEVLRNYEDEVTAAGGEVLFECKREECGGDETRSSSGGGSDMSLMMHFVHEADLTDEAFSNGACALTSKIGDQRYFTATIPVDEAQATLTVQTFQLIDTGYCEALNGRTVALVHVLEPKARERKMVAVKAEEMAISIGETGRIALYGILFDTDKADLKPESDPALKEIAALLATDPALSVLIVGHTDSQGAYDYNLDLSARRAKAVVEALSATHGTDPGRIQPAGAGMMAPVASNDTPEGQARNRRVEVVKLK